MHFISALPTDPPVAYDISGNNQHRSCLNRFKFYSLASKFYARFYYLQTFSLRRKCLLPTKTEKHCQKLMHLFFPLTLQLSVSLNVKAYSL